MSTTNHTSTNNQAKAVMITALQLLLAGTKSNVPPDTPLTISGDKVTGAQASAIFQKLIDASQAVETARATWQAAIVAERALISQQAAFLKAFKALILAMYGTKPDVLAQFGVKARKPLTKLTAAQLLQRSADAQATRALRGTLGSKQKAQIKGKGAPVVVPPPLIVHRTILPTEHPPPAASPDPTAPHTTNGSSPTGVGPAPPGSVHG
jgi:hypothetical protein